jgi:hypothetical protein
VIVLPRVEHFLIIIVFYCNTSVGHCRCSLLLASGGSVVGSLETNVLTRYVIIRHIEREDDF